MKAMLGMKNLDIAALRSAARVKRFRGNTHAGGTDWASCSQPRSGSG